MEEAKLKPCPFCGEDEDLGDYPDGAYPQVICGNCGSYAHYDTWNKRFDIKCNKQLADNSIEHFSPKTPKILIQALRQYQHNDCSGLLAGFDYDDTVRIVCGLQKEINELKKKLELYIESR